MKGRQQMGLWLTSFVLAIEKPELRFYEVVSLSSQRTPLHFKKLLRRPNQSRGQGHTADREHWKESSNVRQWWVKGNPVSLCRRFDSSWYPSIDSCFKNTEIFLEVHNYILDFTNCDRNMCFIIDFSGDGPIYYSAGCLSFFHLKLQKSKDKQETEIFWPVVLFLSHSMITQPLDYPNFI